MMIIVAAAAAAGLAVAQFKQTVLYKATTVLAFDGSHGGGQSGDSARQLVAETGLVKLPSNLERLRDGEKLSLTTDELERAIMVTAEPKTSLVTIVAHSSSPHESVDIANGIREIFVETTQEMSRSRIKSRLADLEGRLAPVRAELAAASEQLQQFLRENEILDLSEESRALQQERSTLAMLREQAKIEREAVKSQMSGVSELIPSLLARIEQETSAAASFTAPSSMSSGRIQRLRQLITEDQERRANIVLLQQRRSALARLRPTKEGLFVSRAEYDQVDAEVRTLEAKVQDTSLTLQWKTQIQELDQIESQSVAGNTPAATLLQTLQSRHLDLQLQTVSVETKIANLEEAGQRVRERMAKIPLLEPRYSELKRLVTELGREEMELANAMGTARRELRFNGSRYTVVSEASLPSHPTRSNRKLLFAASAGGTGSLGLGILFFSILLGGNIRTSGDAEVCSGHKVLGEFVRQEDGKVGFEPGKCSPPHVETFRIAAEAVRTVLPTGGKILCVATGFGEGTTMVASNLASVFGAQETEVLVLDAQLRQSLMVGPGKHGHSWKAGNLEDGESGTATPGLGSFLTQREKTLEEIVVKSDLPGVSVIGNDSVEVSPDALNGTRMSELLREASRRYSFVIIDSPAMEPYFDARALARQCDAALFVVQAGKADSKAVRDAMRSLEATGIYVAGVLVTGVHPAYARTLPGIG